MNSKAILEHREWMKRCGGSLEGYIKHYGSMHSPEHYGNGGEMIWAADFAELIRLYALAQEVTITHQEAFAEVIKQVQSN